MTRHFLLLPILLVSFAGCAAPEAENTEASESELSSCGAAESARRKDARDTTRIASVISDVLGAKVSCTSSDVHRIVVSSSEAYFGTAVRCDVARVCKLAAADFSAAMKKRGFHGWDLVDGVVLGESTSQRYTSCSPLPRGEEACRDGATDTARLEGLIGASLGVRATCTAGPERAIQTTGDHYYLSDVTCRVPSASRAASFDAGMASFGWNGFRLDGTTITGSQTSRVCASYGSPAAAAAAP